jgi:hypothetical protein
MSKGAGRIERLVEHILKDTDRSFTIEEICRLAWPDVASIEKKHRVAVLRAAKSVRKRLGLLEWTSERPPWFVRGTDSDIGVYPDHIVLLLDVVSCDCVS